MPRVLVMATSAILFGALVAGCTSNPVVPRVTATPEPTQSAAVDSAAQLPTCEQVTAVLGALVGTLEFSAAASEAQTTPEAYEQAVCVYTSTDGSSQLGVTVAAIRFNQSEIDGYATLPNAIADERTSQYDAVIQTLAPGDTDDGILDSALYLFDVAYSITIQGVSIGDPVAVTMPQLTVAAAIDAAFDVRALVG